MKKWLVLTLLLFCIPALVWGWGAVIISGSAKGVPTFVLSETWDNDTEDNTWTTLPSGWDDDYTTGALEGAQSLFADDVSSSNGCTTTSLSSSYDAFNAIIKLKVNINSSIGASVELKFLDNSDNVIVKAHIEYNDTTSPGANRLELYYDNGSSYSAVAISPTFTGILYLKLMYSKGTGSDGVAKVYLVEDSEYDSNGWLNAKKIEVTTTTDTSSVCKVSICKSSNSMEVLYDSLRGDDVKNIDY